MLLYTLTRVIRKIRRQKAVGVAVLLAIMVFSVGGNTITFYLFDRAARPELTIWDGLWYSIVSITTIGYGDISSATWGSRIGTAFFIIIIGLATFTAAVGIVVEWIVDIRHKERTGMGKSGVRDHLIIVNFPSESRVRQIIKEYSRDREHRDRDIVVVAHELEELPIDQHNVTFVRGWPLEEDTYERANVRHARQAIVLSTGHDDPRSDSLVASISFVLHNMKPELSIVAECLDPRHAVLFDLTGEVSLVYTLRVANNLLVQEAQDPGVTLLTHAITSNDIEGTLASTRVAGPGSEITYSEVAKRLLDHDVNLVGVIRGGAVAVSFQGMSLSDDDSLVYVSKERHSWKTLGALLA